MAIITMLAYVLVTVFCAVWHGYVFNVLWGWFVVPQFGLPTMSLAMAIGIGLLINYATYRRHHSVDSDKKSSEALIDSGLWAVVFPLIALAIGWVTKQFL